MNVVWFSLDIPILLESCHPRKSVWLYSQVDFGGAKGGMVQGGGGVLRYISDGDVQSPFLGLKFEI